MARKKKLPPTPVSEELARLISDPKDRDRLVDLLAAEQAEGIAKGVKAEWQRQTDEILLRERQLRSLEERIEALSETRNELEGKYGADHAFQRDLDKLEKVIAEISIILFDLREDGQGAGQAMRNKLARQMAKIVDAVAVLEMIAAGGGDATES